MQDGFAEAVLGTRHVVFGYRLQPLSAAHLLYLEAAGSPLVLEGETIAPVDLLASCKICACPIRLRNGSWIPSTRFGDGPRLKWGPVDAWRWARANTRKDMFLRRMKSWKGYVEDYLATPSKMHTPGNSPRQMSAPAVFASALIGSKYFGEQRAWSMGYGLLRTYLDVMDEARGGTVAFEPDEREAQRIEEAFDIADRNGAEILKQMQSKRN